MWNSRRAQDAGSADPGIRCSRSLRRDDAGARVLEAPAVYQLADEPMRAQSAFGNVEDLVQQRRSKARRRTRQLCSSRSRCRILVVRGSAEKDLSLPNASLLGVGGYHRLHCRRFQLPRTYAVEKMRRCGINVQIPVFNGGLFKARREFIPCALKPINCAIQAETVARGVRIAWVGLSMLYGGSMLTAGDAARGGLGAAIGEGPVISVWRPSSN